MTCPASGPNAAVPATVAPVFNNDLAPSVPLNPVVSAPTPNAAPSVAFVGNCSFPFSSNKFKLKKSFVFFNLY